ncbi:putative chitinase 3 [Portunus trituberculatus]|uniref:Putative chitinase 3 n=1 Tax=Portunus trituberculatus TaxID=210409 RepID=A0A5B7ES40_PORTR|nr:putative chitinase 3 [Portunus trituberculatus]
MMLSAAVSPRKAIIDAAYDVPAMAQCLDVVNLMGCDLHDVWDACRPLPPP